MYTNSPSLQKALQEEKDNLFFFSKQVDYSTFKETSPYHAESLHPKYKYGYNVFGKYL